MIKESCFNTAPESVCQAVALIEDFAAGYIGSLPADPRPPLPPELWARGLVTFDRAWRVRSRLIYSYRCMVGCDKETGLFYVIAPVVCTGKSV